MNIRHILSDYVYNHCLETSDILMYGKRPGDRYRFQYYLSRLLYDINMRHIIVKGFIDLVDNEIGHWDFQVAGREWSAIPLITSIQDHVMYYKDIRLNAFMIKRNRKVYGIHNYEEGRPNKLPVLLVDDLCNSTNSFIFCKTVCTNVLNLPVMPYIFAVLNKNNPKRVQPNEYFFDKYMGVNHKALFLLDGEDINEARIRSNAKNLII